jgi:hypothetical protein
MLLTRSGVFSRAAATGTTSPRLVDCGRRDTAVSDTSDWSWPSRVGDLSSSVPGHVAWILKDEGVAADFRASCDRLNEAKLPPTPPPPPTSPAAAPPINSSSKSPPTSASFKSTSSSPSPPSASPLSPHISEEAIHSLYYRVRFAGSDAAALERLQQLADRGEHVAEAHLAIVLEVRTAVM